MLDTDWGSSFTSDRALASQSYPFSDQTTCVSLQGNKLPASLLLDVRLFFPPLQNTQAQSRVYISRIIKTLDKFTIFFGLTAGQAQTNVEFACCAGIPSDVDIVEPTQRRYFTIQALVSSQIPVQLSKVTGSLIVGSAQSLLDFYSFQPSATLLNPACIHLFQSQGIQSIAIGGIKVSGDVKLILTGGLKAQNTGTQTAPIIRLYIDPQYIQRLQAQYTQRLLQLIQTKYGKPVITINGVSPDATGNITLSGSQCVEIDDRRGSLGTILFSNKCASPCCQDSSSLQSLHMYIELLQSQQNILKQYFTTQANAINHMQANLASLIVRGS